MVSRILKNSIFVRIYAGVVVLIVIVAVFCYLLVQIINYQRAQEYRESLTDGISYVMSEGVSRQPELQQKLDWISDASNLLELPISYVDETQVALSRTERKRITERKAVVRYDANNDIANIIIGLRDDTKHFIYIKVEKIGERQMKALPIFVLDYLVLYPGQEYEHLANIKKYFSFPIAIQEVKDIHLDPEQVGRLRRDQSVLLYKDNASIRGATISIVSPMPNYPEQALVLGPVPMFNWMPFQLSAGITLFSLFLLSLGVYGLILPLERKVRQVRYALNKMQAGDLSLRVPIDGHDEMANLASSYNNMSDHIQRLIEAQRELMRAVSHELRTPVARIRFGMEMLAEEEDYHYRVQQVDMIDKDIEALNTLIDEIMTYAKLEQGTPSLDFEEVVLVDVLEQVAIETEALKTQKEIKLIIPSSNLIVDAERRYLHRVVQNLVGNAIRYCDHKVQMSGGIGADGNAYICIEDDGPGIPEQERERIFEAFARLDDSRTRASGGYGLGLSIVSRIAYWFGGEIQVDQSPILGGARFIMSWPAKRAQQIARRS